MFLELGKVVGFLASMLSLYWVAIGAFFVPGRSGCILRRPGC